MADTIADLEEKIKNAATVEEKAALGDILKLRMQTLDALLRQNENLDRSNNLLKQEVETLERSTLSEEGKLKLAQKKIELAEQNLELEKSNLKMYEEAGVLDDTAYENLKKRIEAAKEFSERTKKDNKEILDQEKKREASAEKIKNFNKDILEGLKNQMASAVGLGDVFKSLSDGLTLPMALMKKMVEQAGEMFATVMNANSEFAKTTGQIADRSVGFGYGASQFGIGFEKMNAASMKLFTSMSNFSNQSRDVRENLTLSAAKLENLGVSAEVTGKNFEALTLGLKMSSSEAMKVNEDIAKAAIGAGIAPSKMLGEFASNMPKLAAYGKQAVNVYIDLQKQAKSLGMELSSLTGIVGDQFDTFEGSARAAGKLNAVLGGNYLNSVEMLNATESERIVLLKKSFDESGKNFDALSKYEKKAIAATLGIQDLNEASKLFGKSTSEMTADMAKQAATQEKLEATQREAAKVTDQIKEAFNGLLVAVRPIVTIIKDLVDLITSFMDLGGGFVGFLTTIGVAIWALSGSFAALNMSMVATTAKWLLFAAVIKLLHWALLEPHSPIMFFALMMLPAIILAIGEAADTSKDGLYALGASFLMIGAGIAAAALGLSELVKAFAGLTGPQILGALAAITLLMLGMIAPLVLITIFGAPAAPVLLALGAAFLMIGLGIGIAAAGMALFVMSLKTLADPKVPLGVMQLAVGLYALAPAMLLTAYAGLAMIPFLIVLGAVGIPLMLAFAVASLAVAGAITIAAVGFKIIAESMGLLAEGIKKLSETPILTVFGSLAISLLALIAPLMYFGFTGLPILIAFSATMFVLSVSMAIMSASLLMLVEGLKSLSSLSETLPATIAKLSLALIGLVVSLGAIMMLGAVGGTGLGMMAFVIGLGMMAIAIVSLGKALESLPEGKTVTLQTLNEALTSVKSLKEEDLKPTKEFVTVAKQFYEVQATSKEADKDALVAVLKQLTKTMSSKEEKTNEPMQVKLVISGTELANALNNGNTTVNAMLHGVSTGGRK